METRGEPQPANRMSQGDSNPAAVPHAAEDIQGDDRWMSQHNRFVLDCKDKEPDVLFVGDSMVQLLQQYEIWRELFSPLHALNFGIGGDTTAHVLWRLKNGELENIKPKVIVVWVGTNNHENTAEEVAGGIEAIVRLINTRQPQAKVIVLSLLPRGEKPNPLRQKNAKEIYLDCFFHPTTKMKKMQRKRCERKERILVSELVCGCKQGDSRCRLGDLKGWKLAQYVKSNYSPASW
ncbi:platelet-activating factor acetylhydrolase IB subunit beta isoform X2 [Terrapene carolina triunguis]|uniref:platelet-activating factor acetylhydrolase IB subunit beta isoform X2 n=1 Tax=Terrapene triunguis TaxID=2587831 RepID=UPI000CEFD036|nr:platelet-activating factor acetylhydrolase IB subunit beta isoform X2 [Terrapene carolina triunguis]